MDSFLKRMWGSQKATPLGQADDLAPDGNREMLRSGAWVVQPAIPVRAFPEALVLTEHDMRLAASGPQEVVLATMMLGGHRVELLLSSGGPRVAMIAVRIPTAANQYKEPYMIMECEHGNSREDAVREIDFHLRGRVDTSEIERADWTGFFNRAADKLQGLRGFL